MPVLEQRQLDLIGLAMVGFAAFFGFVFYLGYIWIFIDKRKRGWQDLIGGTVVIDVEPTTYTS